MPGNVPLATPSGVMPFALCKAYSQSLAYDAIQNRYNGGEVQSSASVDAPRRTWKLTQRLAPNAADSLLSFYLAHPGAFWFYDTGRSDVVYDSTATATTGRYPVRFDGSLSLTNDLGRSDAQFSLIQLS